MEYKKPVMSFQELRGMGFTRKYLERAYHSPANTFAFKVSPEKPKSKIMFDTEGFEKWRRSTYLSRTRLLQTPRCSGSRLL